MKLKFCLLLLLPALSIIAQPNFITKFEENITNNLFNGNWQSSDSLIQAKLTLEPNSLKYNSLKAYNAFYTRYVGNDNPYSRDETIRQVMKYSWDAIVNGEELESNVENDFYLGLAYAMLARVNVMEQEFWQAYWNASKSEDYFEDVLDANPEFADANFNLGVYEYFPATTITGFQSVLAWFGGMSGDRDEGISHIKKTSNDGVLFKNEADYALGLIFSYRENDHTTGYEFWENLSEKFPENNNFAFQKQRVSFLKLIEDRGVKFLEEEFDSLEARYNVNNPNVLNNIGYNLVAQQRLEDALLVFKVNLKKYPEIANCYDSLAECYMTMGDNENAIKYYKLAFQKLKTDTTVNDDFRERLEEGIKTNLESMGSKIDV